MNLLGHYRPLPFIAGAHLRMSRLTERFRFVQRRRTAEIRALPPFLNEAMNVEHFAAVHLSPRDLKVAADSARAPRQPRRAVMALLPFPKCGARAS